MTSSQLISNLANTLSQTTALLNFPQLSNAANLGTRLRLRPFGCAAEDLEINFNADSPTLVTQLIRLCTVTSDDVLPAENFYWSLEVGKRIECLIRIALSENSPNIVTVLKCLESDCGRYLELSLLLKDLFSKACCKIDDESCGLTLRGKKIVLRKPTGYDQLSWIGIGNVSHEEAVKRVIATLSENADEEIIHQISTCSNEIIEQLGERLSTIDPLIDYKIELQCPLCGTKNSYRLDLEKLLLKKLSDIQRELLSAIHVLATNYHWTENEILAIPAPRRRLYLSVIEFEKS